MSNLYSSVAIYSPSGIESARARIWRKAMKIDEQWECWTFWVCAIKMKCGDEGMFTPGGGNTYLCDPGYYC